jgi:hypothetical protein
MGILFPSSFLALWQTHWFAKEQIHWFVLVYQKANKHIGLYWFAKKQTQGAFPFSRLSKYNEYCS